MCYKNDTPDMPSLPTIDEVRLKSLIAEYNHACQMVQGNAIPQWRNLVQFLNEELAKAHKQGATQGQRGVGYINGEWVGS